MRVRFSITIIFFNLLFFISSCKAENSSSSDTIFVAFWNIENLFDTIDDPATEDEEFLPSGAKQWTEERLDRKMYNLARVFKMMNEEKAPDIIGVAECENKSLLELFVSKHFNEKKYKITYAESPDNRGIDCGFIYDADKFTLVEYHSYEIKKLQHTPTRLILHTTLKLKKNDEEINLFVNHWPSRRGGASETEYKRIAAAQVLKEEVDKLFKSSKDAKIIIMGDFNDDPIDESILNVLKAIPFKCDNTDQATMKVPPFELYNISYNLFEKGLGTITYNNNWNLFDQIIISSSLIKQKVISYLCDSFSIINNELTTTRSGKYKGSPFPTYGGNRYLGGYSDHFPVTAKFIVR